MKVLHVGYSDTGGAGYAMLRLHKGLLAIGIQSKILVLEKRSNCEEVYEFSKGNKQIFLFKRVLKKIGLPLTLEHKNDNIYRKFTGDFEFFSFAKTSFTSVVNHPLVHECDVVNLHWVPNFIDYKSFFGQINKPIVWTQHDMNAFQGGFHYKEDTLRNDHLKRYDSEQYEYKYDALNSFGQNKLAVVSPSKWLANEAKRSKVLGKFSHFHIPNGIDPRIFYKKSASEFKSKFNLDNGKVTVLFVSETVKSIRKGFNYIQDLVMDESITSKCNFIAVGNIKAAQKVDGIQYLGSIQGEAQISEVYNAADIYLLPSREDNLPNVMLESLACGTPVVGFNVGGIKDLVKNNISGFLSDEVSTIGLKRALTACINDIGKFNNQQIADEISSNYSIIEQANKYRKVYNGLLNADNELELITDIERNSV